MPSCGKASQRPPLIHVNIEKHLTEVGSHCFPNKWGPGAALLWKWTCRVSFQAEDSTGKVPSSKTGRLPSKSSLIIGGHPGDSQVNTDFVFKCESFPKGLAKSDSNQGVGREDRAPKWALWRQSPCPHCLIRSRCPENEASVEGLEQGETAVEYKRTGMIWVEADTLLSPVGRNQETDWCENTKK